MDEKIKKYLKELAAQTFAEIEEIRKEREVAIRRVQMFEYSVRVMAFRNMCHVAVFADGQWVDYMTIESGKSEKILSVCSRHFARKINEDGVLVEEVNERGTKHVSYKTRYENLEKAIYLILKAVQRLHDCKN